MDGLQFSFDSGDGAPIPTLENFDLSSGLVSGQRLGGSSNRQAVQFRYESVHRLKNIFENGKVVRTVMESVRVEYVRIITPGDKNIYDGEAQDFHKRMFFAQYAAFRQGRTAPLGKSVDECEYISPVLATELRMLGIHTQEQLADAADVVCDRLPDGWTLREHARVVCSTERTEAPKREIAEIRKLAEDSAAANRELAERNAELERKLEAAMRQAADSTPGAGARQSKKKRKDA